ncbi:MAG: nickel pincer cofactor biosynthesis protein LarC [Planctomycetota bacterium]|nr:MAG: nickel pincer cofactor biosynthesis protein LarC [Planctomycetota bacterium]REK45866.1 MAG: nickel pincer cofactor biosynthesis protein LarC [Planctomycetota bacterium]
MKIAYLDCASGISGDMTLAALVDAGVELAALQSGIDSLGLPSCRLAAQDVSKHHFRALQITVEHEPEHAHRHLSDIVGMIEASRLSARQQELAKQIFTRLGEAEAKVHGTSIEKVHFHEVGAVDSIADIVGAAIGFDLLGVERVYASPVPTGHGTIEIAHGRCSIPAPATAELLQGIPLAACDVEAELTTPTGAAILATLVHTFGPLPGMTIARTGIGAGQRDLEQQANVLRLHVGELAAGDLGLQDTVCVLETNLDDTTGELVGECAERLRAAGALDVTTQAIQMKKNRPGVTITVLCRPEQRAEMEAILFRETTTLGVRGWLAERRTLRRQAHQVDTSFGAVAGQVAFRGEGLVTFAPEYESCRELAAAQNVSVARVFEAAQAAFDPSGFQ